MSSIRRHALVSTVVIATVIVGSAACGQPDFLAGGSGDALTDTAKTDPAAATTAAGGDSEDCTDDTAAADDTTAKADAPGAACCEDLLPGKAHCLAVSANRASSLTACPSGGSCVPDSLAAHEAPKSCDTGFGGENGAGVCVSLCVKAVADNKASLKQATCAANEVCAPCISPLTNKSTTLCDLGKPSASSAPAAKKTCTKKTPAATGDAPAADTKPADTTTPAAGGVELCCGGKGTCVPTAAAGDDSKNLEQKECASADKVCAPSEMIPKANFKPKTCKGHAFTGDYTGVCLSKCLSFSTLQNLVVEQGDCDADHECAPCKYPVIGTASGAPGCAE